MRAHKIQFLTRAITLMIVFLIILTALNQLYIINISNKKSILREEVQWQSFKENLPNRTLNFAIMGDSHSRNAINPLILNDSYNFGVGYEDYTETYYRLNKILSQDNIKVNNLILELDLHTFSDQMRRDEKLFQKLEYYETFVPLSDIARLKRRNWLGLYIESKIKIIGKGKEIFLYYLHPRELTQTTLGWTNFSGNLSGQALSNSAANKYKEHFKYNNANLLENRSFYYFQKVLKIANENDINIIIIRYPLSHEYHLEVEKNNLQIDEHYQDLFFKINQTTRDYQLLNYYDLFFGNPEYFSDSDHLNWIGAEILTKKVLEEVSI